MLGVGFFGWLGILDTTAQDTVGGGGKVFLHNLWHISKYRSGDIKTLFSKFQQYLSRYFQSSCCFLYLLDLFGLFLVPFLMDKIIHWAQLETQMNDLIYIGLTLMFFALTYGLIVVCARLMEDK